MDYIKQLVERYPLLASIREDIDNAFQTMVASFSKGGKLLVAGNGGSAADADHIVGELMKGFVKRRNPDDAFLDKAGQWGDVTRKYLAENLQRGLPAIALSGHTALITASLNDLDANIIYAQQVYVYGQAGDTFMGISTSGNASNVWHAMLVAKTKGMKTIALSGNTGGKIARVADVAILVPETTTYKIQEFHLPIYHTLCLMLEDYFFQ